MRLINVVLNASVFDKNASNQLRFNFPGVHTVVTNTVASITTGMTDVEYAQYLVGTIEEWTPSALLADFSIGVSSVSKYVTIVFALPAGQPFSTMFIRGNGTIQNVVVLMKAASTPRFASQMVVSKIVTANNVLMACQN